MEFYLVPTRDEAGLGIVYPRVIGLLCVPKLKGIVVNVMPLVLLARDEINFFISDTVIDEVRRLVGE